MEPWVHRHIESMLVPTPRSWQPADFLPDPASPDFLDAVRALRRRCEGVPPAAWLVIVGDMVTEEALPSYMSMLNRMDGAADESGAFAERERAWAYWPAMRWAYCLWAERGEEGRYVGRDGELVGGKDGV